MPSIDISFKEELLEKLLEAKGEPYDIQWRLRSKFTTVSVQSLPLFMICCS